MLTAIVGINWGDEGKGRMVDLISQDYGIVCRYQGGNNAGHTVKNDRGEFVLNLIPSGIFRENGVSVMGLGMVIDLAHLVGEIYRLREKGIDVTPDNLKISDKATIVLPYHVEMDGLEEDRLGDKKQGSTRRGIGPAYSDKYMRKSIRTGDLLDFGTLRDKLEIVLGYKNVHVHKGYGAAEISLDETLAWLKKFGGALINNITDTGEYLLKAADNGENILFEAQLGALRDIDYGIYPYTSSSTTLASYGPTGAGIPMKRLDKVIGIMKAYSSAVGSGPFTVEMSGDEATELRRAGNEYGAATGRPRRVGAFDVPASRYGVKVQGADEVALTKLDVLSYMDEIPVCVAYNIDGAETTEFPTGDRLERAKPVYIKLPGFKSDISKCRKPSDLPQAAMDYIRYVEKAVGCKIKYVSVGANREDYLML
ncbi:adenylosuccinate synthetase [Clostridia bacterium]|nr:adenylosuccinate synthetase [Clostridia bacterium]